ncbi:MAG: RnfABCDGE type electron transport complex subunit D [Clostridia bacterium]|nr:RnfABCDGE type electron transport complex subunit D [Clostridia bacterium]
MKKNKKNTPVTEETTDVVEVSEDVPASAEIREGENEITESGVVTDEVPEPIETDTETGAAEVLDDAPALWEEHEEDDGEAEAAPTLSRVRLSPAPFVRTSDKTRSLMLDVIIALLPAYLWGIYTFGTRVLTVGVVAIASCVLFEALMQLILHRPIKIGDLSAVVTGLLLTMGFSSAVPIWMPIVGAFVSIVIMKGLFGGIGRNLVNPALAARVLLLMWPSQLHIFTAPGERLSGIGLTHVESVTTPLDALHAGAFPNVMLFDLILGRTAGCIGEIFPVLLLAGGIYLIVRRVISWRIPVAYIGTVACLTFFFPQIEGSNLNFMLCELFSGGLLLGAFFMATDPVTSPTTPYGHLIYGVGCGVLTVLFRYFGYFAEGMPFAILIMNLLVWIIDRYVVPTPFGGRVAHEKS